MTLDTTSLITLTDSALEGGSTLGTLAGQLASMPTAGTRGCRGMPGGLGTMIVVVGSSPHDLRAMEQRSAALCATGDLYCRSNLLTLPARENAQKLVSLLRMLDTPAVLLDPVLYAPITRGHALEAEPRLLHAKRFEQAALRGGVLVLAGGVGRTPEGETTSLGTGGAELSGLFIAQRLGLPVDLIVPEREANTVTRDTFTLPKRASLFARKHGVAFGVRPSINALSAADQPVPA